MEDARLTQLGGTVSRFASPEEAVLERVPNLKVEDWKGATPPSRAR